VQAMSTQASGTQEHHLGQRSHPSPHWACGQYGVIVSAALIGETCWSRSVA
jgi:hypothetical protein